MQKKIFKLSILTLGFMVFISTNSNAQSSETGAPLMRQGEGTEKMDRNGPPSTDQIFEKMDIDKNNKLEASEVEGPLKDDFSTIDTNNDGFITKQELNNAPKPERKGPPKGNRDS